MELKRFFVTKFSIGKLKSQFYRTVLGLTIACFKVLSAGLSESQIPNNDCLNFAPLTVPLYFPFLLTTTPLLGK